MRVVIQRCKEASVSVDNIVLSSIGYGLMILVGIEETDSIDDIEWLSTKLINLRIFDDEEGIMNKSIIESKGEILCISQFTLYASTKKGNRPSYIKSAKSDKSRPLYEVFCNTLDAKMGLSNGRGLFGANMQVKLINDGPVTIIIDSKIRE